MSGTRTAPTIERDTLSTGRLGIWGIVFLVASAAAPLTVVVSAAPMAFRLGGIGAPGAMLLCGAILALFAAGFTAMSSHVPNAGAFYAYALHGLGKSAGVGLALVTAYAYAFLCFCFYAFIGFFGELVLTEWFGSAPSWWVIALVSAGAVGLLGMRQVDVGAKVLAVLVTAEVAILLVIAAAVLLTGGPEAASAAGFDPRNLLAGGGIGMLLVIGFGAFLGFEGTAIYAEEAKRPGRTIPRATYLVVALLAAFYAFTFWILTLAFGVDGVLAFAAGDDFESMVFTAAGEFVGPLAAGVVQILIVTSFFACILAFHNACTRYLFSLGREGILPSALGRTHRVHKSPATASLTLSVACIAGIAIAAVFVTDAYLGLAVWTYATGVLGLVFGQALAAVAVVAFFARDRRGHSPWRVIVAPVLGAAGLIAAVTLIVIHFELTTGMNGAINWVLILPTPLLFITGMIYERILKKRRPALWAALGRTEKPVERETD
ncbi:amino acid permease [Kocuria polaris]|nr:amino acid permease [Kocuria polaris]